MSRTAPCGWADWEMIGLMGGEPRCSFSPAFPRGIIFCFILLGFQAGVLKYSDDLFYDLGLTRAWPSWGPGPESSKAALTMFQAGQALMYHTYGGSTAQRNKSQTLESSLGICPRERHRCSNAKGPGWVKKLFLQVTTEARPHSHRCCSGPPDNRGSTCTTYWQGWTSSITPMAPMDGNVPTLFFKIPQRHPTHLLCPVWAQTIVHLAPECLQQSGGEVSSSDPLDRMEGLRRGAARITTTLSSGPAELWSAGCGRLGKSGFSQGLVSWIQVIFLHRHFFLQLSSNIFPAYLIKKPPQLFFSVSLLFSWVLNSCLSDYLLVCLFIFHKGPTQGT